MPLLLLPSQLLPSSLLPSQLLQLLQEEEDASDFTSGLSSDLLFYPPEHVLAGQYMFDDWDPALVRAAAQCVYGCTGLCIAVLPGRATVPCCLHRGTAVAPELGWAELLAMPCDV
jgi:hypothetical protein